MDGYVREVNVTQVRRVLVGIRWLGVIAERHVPRTLGDYLVIVQAIGGAIPGMARAPIDGIVLVGIVGVGRIVCILMAQ